MSKGIKIVLIVVIVIAVAFFFLIQKGKSIAGNCISVPDGLSPWTNTFSGTDWGAYGRAREKYLGLDPNDVDSRDLVDGFFKGIDVEPKAAYVKYFQAEINNWIASGKSIPHWNMESPGMLRC